MFGRDLDTARNKSTTPSNEYSFYGSNSPKLKAAFGAGAAKAY
jgi:hypothetical protein